jgi:hypothetical protein
MWRTGIVRSISSTVSRRSFIRTTASVSRVSGRRQHPQQPRHPECPRCRAPSARYSRDGRARLCRALPVRTPADTGGHLADSNRWPSACKYARGKSRERTRTITAGQGTQPHVNGQRRRTADARTTRDGSAAPAGAADRSMTTHEPRCWASQRRSARSVCTLGWESCRSKTVSDWGSNASERRAKRADAD